MFWLSLQILSKEFLILRRIQRYIVINVHTLNANLMFFWPCIMNWLYINYQLDALIIIYS